ncbi:MAG: arginase [Clostridia bacterium]|nr:arginase [Clostridia bacterium]MCI9413414.1 arginase [Clostridia bacterium]
MKKIAIINACTDLGVHVNGASLGAQILTKDLCSNSTVSHCYTLKDSQAKEQVNPKNPVTTCQEIDDFVQEFNRLLLTMHELHFEEKMTTEEIKSYQKKMHDLVLSVKALDTKNEKRNLEQINEFNEKLYKQVLQVIEADEFPLTVGGDHIIAIASSLASIQKHQNLGMIWFDSHADYNTYATSVTGNLHGLPLAVATHFEKDILADFHKGPFYNPKQTVIVGGRDIDPWEWENVLEAGVTVFSTKDIQQYGAEEICRKAFEIASNGTNGVHISFDLDLIDPNFAPGVSVPAKNGISLEETYNLVDEIVKYANIIKSADLVEYNPVFDIDNKTANLAKEILNKWIENF